ncbi:MAG TPA: alpha/beta hydrolase [Mucilaginibacter sp.]|jgi:dienelactone hydrolase|nr:alpha/beta hydrolase [Mucilaginibacter sp.]
MMLKNPLIFSLIFFFYSNMQAQTHYRYKNLVFQDVRIDKDLSYNVRATEKKNKAYLFDLFQPENDNETRRPLIIWMHGGGFKYGSKSAKNIQLWCKTFAQRGYVCVAVNYHLSKNNPVFNFDEFLKASYYAVQDLRMAVEYFKKNAGAYHIDPDKIILAGNSAGGIIALQAAYSSDEELVRLAKLPPDSASKNKAPVNAVAIINFWGAIYNLDWLKNERIPIVSALGSNDNIVPPTHKSAPLFGGKDINERADELHIPNDLDIFEGYSHELQKHFNPFFSGGKDTQLRWLEAGQFAADFLFKTIIK